MSEEASAVELDVNDLDAFFKKRREEEKPDAEILREVFELNPDADIKKLEEITKLPSLTIGRIKGQVSIRRKRESKASEKSLEEGEISEIDARQLVAQSGRDGLNKLKRGFLKKTLAIAPQMTEKTAEWILHKWDINQRIQNDPNEFYAMLHNETGLKPNTAISIAHDVFGLEEQYADILEGRGERPIFISGSPRSSGEPGAEPFAYRRDQYSSGGGPFEVSGRGGRGGYPDQPGQFLTREEYLKLERERDEKRRVEKMEEKIDKIAQDVGGSISSLEEKIMEKLEKKSSDESSVEEIPLDAEGKPTTPDKAASVKRVYRGSGGGLPREDPLDMMIKMEKLRQEMAPKDKGEDPEIRDLKNQMHDETQKRLDGEKEHQKQVEDLRNKIAEDEKTRAKEQIDKLDSKIDNMGTEMNRLADKVSSGGVNSVEGMLTSVGTKLVDKAPLREAGQLVKDLLTPSGSVITSPAQAPAVTQSPGASSGILAVLRDKGLVTTVRERVVGPR